MRRTNRHTGESLPGRFEFKYRDSTGQQRWQTARGVTKAEAKAERAEMVVRLYWGERVQRSSSRTVGEAAQAWLERERGLKGP